MRALTLKILAGVALSIFAANANAMILVPSDAFIDEITWHSDASNPYINNPDASDVEVITGGAGLVELYKDDVGGSESGLLAGSYETTYDSADPSLAEISYVGGSPYAMDASWLVVKDGKDPIWYLFDISGWDGMETIYIGTDASPFWPGSGAISHINFFGSEVSEVSAPSVIALLGLGLLGLAAIRRRSA